jgi:hypothetical protein
MSSKVGRKKKSSAEKSEQRSELKERNQKLKEELAAPRQPNVLDKLSKWRVATYAWIIFLPPYGLYRVWSEESTFTSPEKVVWTFMIIAIMLRFLWSILFA